MVSGGTIVQLLASYLPDFQVGSNVAVQRPRTKLWDTYGIVTSIGPCYQYHITGRKGQNCHLLQYIAPASIPELWYQVAIMQSTSSKCT